MRHPIDVATMFAALWLLASMVVDLLTPKELTIYMIAAATAPAFMAAALCYYFQVPRLDFAVIFAMLWLVASLAIEWISPKPLPTFIIGAAFVPPLIVGLILHWHRRVSDKRPAATARRTKPSVSA